VPELRRRAVFNAYTSFGGTRKNACFAFGRSPKDSPSFSSTIAKKTARAEQKAATELSGAPRTVSEMIRQSIVAAIGTTWATAPRFPSSQTEHAWRDLRRGLNVYAIPALGQNELEWINAFWKNAIIWRLMTLSSSRLGRIFLDNLLQREIRSCVGTFRLR